MGSLCCTTEIEETLQTNYTLKKESERKNKFKKLYAKKKKKIQWIFGLAWSLVLVVLYNHRNALKEEKAKSHSMFLSLSIHILPFHQSSWWPS